MKITPYLAVCTCKKHARITYADGRQSEDFSYQEKGIAILKCSVMGGLLLPQYAMVIESQIRRSLPTMKDVVRDIDNALKAIRAFERECREALYVCGDARERFEGRIMN